MKRFKFPLDTLLKYREVIERKKKAEWAISKKEREEEEKKLYELIEEEESMKKFLKSNLKGEIDVKTYYDSLNYISTLIKLQENQKEVILEKRKIEEEKLNEWLKAKKDKRAIELYKEKLWKEYLMALDKEEQKMVDDIFLMKEGRKKDEKEL